MAGQEAVGAAEDDRRKEMRAHVWNYFTIHAGQRISMFNFFLVLTGLVAAGLAACLQGQGVLRLLGAVMGLFLAVVALAFFKLDQRSSFLVKHAEGAMVKLESTFTVAEARIFTAEIPDTAAGTLLPASRRMWTYGTSLRFIFLVTGLAGLSGGILSLCRYLGWIG
jgi:hypothetical protein